MSYGISVPWQIIALLSFAPLLWMLGVAIIGAIGQSNGNNRYNEIWQKYGKNGYMVSALFLGFFSFISLAVLSKSVIGALIVACIGAAIIYRQLKLVSVGVKITEAKEKVSKISVFISSSGTLKLEERSPYFGILLTIEKYVHFDVKYEPEKYVYTSATVGGITTGGIHKEDAYHYLSNGESTGRYYLDYCDNSVKKIQLSSELLKKAKNSKISKYITGDYIVVYDSDAVQMPEYIAKAIQTQTLDAMNLASQYIAKGYPTYSKCEEILNWICGHN